MIQFRMVCNRVHKRESIIRAVYFSGVPSGAYMACSLDVSNGGFCVLTDLNMIPGQTVKVFSSALWSEPREAVAVWRTSDQVNGDTVGFRFCQPDDLIAS